MRLHLIATLFLIVTCHPDFVAVAAAQAKIGEADVHVSSGSEPVRSPAKPAARKPTQQARSKRRVERAVAITDGTFPDGTMAHFDVGAPWWSWLWLGLIYQPARGKINVFTNVQKPVREWWCLWLCKETQTVQQPVNAVSLTVDALGLTVNPAGEQVTNQGEDFCGSCSSVTHYVHNFGFPAPPWAGGGGFKGIGFRGSAIHAESRVVLHDHWGTDKTTLGAPAFPPDFD